MFAKAPYSQTKIAETLLIGHAGRCCRSRSCSRSPTAPSAASSATWGWRWCRRWRSCAVCSPRRCDGPWAEQHTCSGLCNEAYVSCPGSLDDTQKGGGGDGGGGCTHGYVAAESRTKIDLGFFLSLCRQKLQVSKKMGKPCPTDIWKGGRRVVCNFDSSVFTPAWIAPPPQTMTGSVHHSCRVAFPLCCTGGVRRGQQRHRVPHQRRGGGPHPGVPRPAGGPFRRLHQRVDRAAQGPAGGHPRAPGCSGVTVCDNFSARLPDVPQESGRCHSRPWTAFLFTVESPQQTPRSLTA